MPDDFQWVVFLVGMLRVTIWWVGAALAWYRKRYLACVGFGLAGCAGGILAYGHAASDEPSTVDVAWVLSTMAVGLIVGSFVAAQPKGVERPATWTP